MKNADNNNTQACDSVRHCLSHDCVFSSPCSEHINWQTRRRACAKVAATTQGMYFHSSYLIHFWLSTPRDGEERRFVQALVFGIGSKSFVISTLRARPVILHTTGYPGCHSPNSHITLKGNDYVLIMCGNQNLGVSVRVYLSICVLEIVGKRDGSLSPILYSSFSPLLFPFSPFQILGFACQSPLHIWLGEAPLWSVKWTTVFVTLIA